MIVLCLKSLGITESAEKAQVDQFRGAISALAFLVCSSEIRKSVRRLFRDGMYKEVQTQTILLLKANGFAVSKWDNPHHFYACNSREAASIFQNLTGTLNLWTCM